MITIQIDELTREEFGFCLINFTLYLDSYQLLKRIDKRHGYKRIKWYERLNSRNCSMTESEVPFTQEIKDMAINQYMAQISCKKWSER